MKGYKVFKPDWTCRGKQYAVGETATQDGELEMCRNGIHFCTELADCFRYYSANPANKLAEVEALGEVLQEDGNSKCCTDRLKIVRELSIAELLKKEDFCLKVVLRDPYQIRFMRDRDQKVFLTAVKQNGLALEYVPKAMKTPQICLTAVQQNGYALSYVPEALKTEDICLAAIEQDGWALENIPEAMKTPELCLTAVQQDGRALSYVPERLKTPELCMEAVQQNGWALEFVPEKLKTFELCMAAMQQNGMALQFMQSKQTPELCMAAVQQNGKALMFVVEQTYEICKAAIRQNMDAVYDIRDSGLQSQFFQRLYSFSKTYT